MTGVFSHFSAEAALGVIAPMEQGDPRKPRGLWISVDGPDDWPSWCLSEGFRLDRLRHRHVVTLADGAAILRLETAADVSSLFKLFNTGDTDPWSFRSAIDWKRIAYSYQGIIIAPYQWSCRHAYAWYYSWDCASGCIWDPAAIASIERDASWVQPTREAA